MFLLHAVFAIQANPTNEETGADARGCPLICACPGMKKRDVFGPREFEFPIPMFESTNINHRYNIDDNPCSTANISGETCSTANISGQTFQNVYQGTLTQETDVPRVFRQGVDIKVIIDDQMRVRVAETWYPLDEVTLLTGDERQDIDMLADDDEGVLASGTVTVSDADVTILTLKVNGPESCKQLEGKHFHMRYAFVVRTHDDSVRRDEARVFQDWSAVPPCACVRVEGGNAQQYVRKPGTVPCFQFNSAATMCQTEGIGRPAYVVQTVDAGVKWMICNVVPRFTAPLLPDVATRLRQAGYDKHTAEHLFCKFRPWLQ